MGDEPTQTTTRRTSRPVLGRLLLLVVAVAGFTLFPVLLLGLAFEDRIEAWVSGSSLSISARFGVIVLLLAGDILLPIPSSAVTTWGGGVLGVGLATVASSLGMTLGAMVGFSLARALGRRFVDRRATPEDQKRIAVLVSRFGPIALVLTRPLPILAEACVLLVGTTGLSWRRFVVPVVASSFVVSLTYAAAGAYFHDRGSFAPAIVLSGTLPLLAALLARRLLPRHSEPTNTWTSSERRRDSGTTKPATSD